MIFTCFAIDYDCIMLVKNSCIQDIYFKKKDIMSLLADCHYGMQLAVIIIIVNIIIVLCSWSISLTRAMKKKYLFVIFLQIIKKFNQTLLTHAHDNVEINDLRKEKSKYQWYKDLSMNIFVNGIVFAPCRVEDI